MDFTGIYKYISGTEYQSYKSAHTIKHEYKIEVSLQIIIIIIKNYARWIRCIKLTFILDVMKIQPSHK